MQLRKSTKRDLYRTCRVRDDAPTIRAGQFARCEHNGNGTYTLTFADDRQAHRVPTRWLERFAL